VERSAFERDHDLGRTAFGRSPLDGENASTLGGFNAKLTEQGGARRVSFWGLFGAGADRL